MMTSVPKTLAEVSSQAKSTVQQLVKDYDAFFFDCDGTLYHAGTILPNVAEAINFLRSLDKRIFFVTNTSSRSRVQLQAKLRKMGVPCEVDECVPSCVFTADYVKKTHPTAQRVYVIGGQGVVDELANLGIDSSGGPKEDDTKFSDEEFKALADIVGSERYDGVIVGWDTAFNYYKVAKSSLVFQRHPNVFFYATNDDPSDQVGGWLLPGNGPLLKAVENSCSACSPSRIGRAKPYGCEAEVLGKPNPAYARLIAEWNGIDLKRSVMVGDRLDTDILMGQRAGMASLHVLTGVDSIDQISAKQIQPDFVLPEVGCIWTERDVGDVNGKL